MSLIPDKGPYCSAQSVFIDGFGGANGTFTLNASGVIKTGESCRPADLTSGLMTCEGGGACKLIGCE